MRIAQLETLSDNLADLSTSHVADACWRLKIGLRVAPAGIRSVRPGQRLAGRALPARYSGDMDGLVKALDHAEPGDVLVVDNKGRLYESCLGRLTALQAVSADLAGAVLWGVHRDNDALSEMDFPVFSYGTFPRGPLQARQPHPEALVSARVGAAVITRDDIVIADSNGVMFVPSTRLSQLLETARSMAARERDQVEAFHKYGPARTPA